MRSFAENSPPSVIVRQFSHGILLELQDILVLPEVSMFRRNSTEIRIGPRISFCPPSSQSSFQNKLENVVKLGRSKKARTKMRDRLSIGSESAYDYQ